MGNKQDHVDTADFMLDFYRKQKEFLQEQPLFEVEEIKFPLSTNGMKIVDQTGRRVKLAGINWSGGHAKRHTIAGLDRQHITSMLKMVKEEFKMNVIRLTFSLELFYSDNKIPDNLLSHNPQMKGKTAMQIFDITVQQMTKAGFMVYLNNHTSKSQWCCSNSDGDGLWYSNQYSQQKFFACLRALAKRYKDNPRVIGMDLRNQIRKANGKTPTWGDGNKETDWRLAAETIGNQVQDICPHWLIIVGGIEYQTDLTDIHSHPIHLKVPNKLVYSGHIYGFSWPVWVAGYWKVASYGAFFKKMFNDQLYVRNLGVPFILGEFGNNNRDKYWQYLMKLLQDTDIDWTYWCVDGYKCDDQENQTYGLLTQDFKYARYPWMIQDLKKVGKPKKKGGLRLNPTSAKSSRNEQKVESSVSQPQKVQSTLYPSSQQYQPTSNQQQYQPSPNQQKYQPSYNQPQNQPHSQYQNQYNQRTSKYESSNKGMFVLDK